MSACGLSEQLLYAWLDGEAGGHTATVQTHVDTCRECAAHLVTLKQAQRVLTQLIDRGVGELEPLLALQNIRRRIRATAERGLWADLLDKAEDVWLFNRRAVVGLAAAVGLSALTAPLLALGVAKLATAELEPAVVVESLQVQNDAKAVVVHENDSSITLIWVEAARPAAPPRPLAPPEKPKETQHEALP